MSKIDELFNKAWPTQNPLMRDEAWDVVRDVAEDFAKHVLADKQVRDTMLNGLNVQNGQAILSLEGGACGLLAGTFANQFKESGASNYLVLDFNHDDTGPMTITMQRKHGSTPAEALETMRSENEKLKAELEALKLNKG